MRGQGTRKLPAHAADQAVVLVGGLGTRLRAVVADVPKPLAPVAGRPFLAWVLDQLAQGGLRRIVLATGHMSGQVEQLVGRRWCGMAVEYSVEEQPLGTGGALRHALPLLDGNGVHVVNGDTFLRYAPAALEQITRERGAAIGVALAEVADVARYGAVDSVDGRVVAFREKGSHGRGWINAGCYFMTAETLASLPEAQVFSLETQVLQPATEQGRVTAYTDTDGFIDIGVPADYARAQQLFGDTP